MMRRNTLKWKKSRKRTSLKKWKDKKKRKKDDEIPKDLPKA